MSNPPVVFILDESEIEILMMQDPATKSGGGFQRLMVNLQENFDDSTSAITLNADLLEKIPRYAFQYDVGGWEDRLTGIFSRHLGEDLKGLKP